MREMEKEDFQYDELLKRLIKNSPLEAPSGDFVEKVMGKIPESPVISPSARPFYLNFKSVLPFVLLGIFCLVIILTSDFPFMGWFQRKEFFTRSLIPYFLPVISGFKAIFINKYFSFAFMILLAGTLLVIIERLFSRKSPENQMG